MATPKITHILFDLDGTLVNTIDLLIVILTELIRQNNKEITPNIIAYTPNLESLASLNEFIRADIGLHLDQDEFNKTLFREITESTFELCPGVEKLVKHFHKHNVPIAIASATYRAIYDKQVKQFGTFFTDYFSHAVIGKDDPEVINQKPHPDTYFLAARRFANPPQSMGNVLIFEDSITGLIGAVKTGAKVVLVSKVSEKVKEDHAELLSKVDLIIDSMEHFKPEEFGLPSF